MICRVCLKESSCSLKIFDMNGKQLGIADILQRHFWFQPKPDDTISTVICRVCWITINEFHQFYLMVEQAHHSLRLYPEASDEKGKFDSAVAVNEEVLLCEVDIKEELFDNVFGEDNRSTEELEETKNPLLDVEFESNSESGIAEFMKSEEPEDNTEEKTVSKDLDRTRKRKCVLKNLAQKIADMHENAKEDNEKQEAEASEEKLTKCKGRNRRRKGIPERKKPSSKIIDENESDHEGEPKRRKTMITHQDDEIVKKHIAMGCNLCTFVAEDFSDMSKHFRIQHDSTKPYVICCNKKLNKRAKVVQHAYIHEDPEFFKCQECKKSFSDRYSLRSHMVAAHAPEELLTFPCELCPRKFAKKRLLEQHKASHVPVEERSFICDQCPNEKSRFASNHLLKIHVITRHQRATNVCHVCAKEIRDKQAFEKHVRLHFEDSGPRVQCPRPDCDRWLKDEDNLRKHLRRHNDDGQIFTCADCGHVCKNRRALGSHISYVHSSEVFTCEECNKSFKKAITLREHMAQHTGESLYKCPFCTRTFNSNANMHSHKKKSHPIEWDNWRKTKRGSSQTVITKQHGLQNATNSFDKDSFSSDAAAQQ